jgi:PAS domain-containing protein
MIEDARALVSIAEGLRGLNPNRDPPDATSTRPSPSAGGRAVLVHAVSIDEGDGGRVQADDKPPLPLPILVLLDDAPAVPDFLPETDDIGPTLSEEQVHRAIERRVRGALNRAPTERYVSDLVESIQDAVIVIDRQRTVVYLNTSAVSLLQSLTRRTGPFVGQPIASAFPPAASATVRPAIQDALVHADASRVEDPERHRGLALDIAIFPNPHGATLLVRDVTERKDIEAELVEARLSLARAEARLRTRGDEAPP